MPAKRIPERQCLGCREMKPKTKLLRVVKSPENEISLDIKGKKPGRGAYICPDTKCLERIIKSKALSRVFKTQVPESIIQDLQKQMEKSIV